MKAQHWNGHETELARSVGGVYAFRSPWEGVLRGGVAPWPPPELVQKLYQSRQSRAYRDGDAAVATAALGYYSDLQSVHSEDAITWSLFGPLVYASAEVRSRYAADLLAHIGLAAAPAPANFWLWRRLPHPDSLVPGGPEIDFGIQTDRVLVLGEAKWRSGVGTGQGVGGAKDQIQLRAQFCAQYGASIYPDIETFVVLLVGNALGAIADSWKALRTERLLIVESTWAELGGLQSNPWRTEFLAQLAWRRAHSQAV
jgi:hypothetical protein